MVRAAPVLTTELVVVNWNDGGMIACTTTPEALPGPRLITVTVKGASVVPGVKAPEKPGVSVIWSWATPPLHAERVTAIGARSESATTSVSRDASVRTRLQRETVRPWLRFGAARAGDAAATPSG